VGAKNEGIKGKALEYLIVKKQFYMYQVMKCQLN
jgi:hypothetical protein